MELTELRQRIARAPLADTAEESAQLARTLLGAAELHTLLLLIEDPRGERRPAVLAELAPALAWLARELESAAAGTAAATLARGCVDLAGALERASARPGTPSAGTVRRACGALWDAVSTLRHAQDAGADQSGARGLEIGVAQHRLARAARELVRG
jgi:hypothetical protein